MQNQWWTDVPLVFTKDDYEGLRMRFLIAQKRVRCETRIIDRDNQPPDSLTSVNVTNTYPVLVDKHLICHGPALDELFHERYPAPTLLPVGPLGRAQVRMLEQHVRGWYSLSPNELAKQVKELVSIYNGATEWFTGPAISIVDIALAPILYLIPTELLEAIHGTPFFHYRERVIASDAFQESLKSQRPHNDMSKDVAEIDDADLCASDDDLLEEFDDERVEG